MNKLWLLCILHHMRCTSQGWSVSFSRQQACLHQPGDGLQKLPIIRDHCDTSHSLIQKATSFTNLSANDSSSRRDGIDDAEACYTPCGFDFA